MPPSPEVTSRPCKLTLWTTLVMLTLPSSVVSTMVVSNFNTLDTGSGVRGLTATSTSSSSPFQCVKAYTTVGPNTPYEEPFSSLSHSAPLFFLDPSDPVTCPHCCSSLLTSSIPLSSAVSSLITNRTVVLTMYDLSACKPRLLALSGLETMFATLVGAGARAVITVTKSKVPGIVSNIVGTGDEGDRRVARGSEIPFVSIGPAAGERLVKQLVESQLLLVENQQLLNSSHSPSSPPSSSDVHVTFTYDENAFFETYAYFSLPFKCISYLTFGFIVHRCLSLGLHVHPTSKLLGLPLPLLTSTKNLIVLMAIPSAASIMIQASVNGWAVMEEGSKSWVYFTTGFHFPNLNLASSLLVARLWRVRQGRRVRQGTLVDSDDANNPNDANLHHEDPAFTEPVKTLLIVFVALTADILFVAANVFFKEEPTAILTAVFVPLTVGCTFVSVFFLHAGIQSLRTLRTLSVSGGAPVHMKMMSVYLLMVAVSMLMVISSFAMVGTGAWSSSVGAYFLNNALYSFGNYSSTLLHMLVFTAKAAKHGTDEADSTSGDETFLETSHRELTERNRLQDGAIARLQAEKDEMEQRAELEQKLASSFEAQAELNAKLLESEKKANLSTQKEKASFMAALHEVRNPLNGIVLTLEFISESLSHELSADMKKEIESIQTCADHQQLLLKSIMDLDKIMAGSKDLPVEKFDPARLCRDAITMNKHAAPPGVNISAKSTLEAGSIFIGAPTQLNLVLVNLLSNAAKFTSTGQIEISVDIVGEEEEGEAEGETITETKKEASDSRENENLDKDKKKIVKFAVTDTGPGVPQAMQEKIFGMRGQAGNAKSQAKGFGIGLFVAHELVERMGGKIKLRSPVTEDGRGSEFSFELVIEECAALLGELSTQRCDIYNEFTQENFDKALAEAKGWRVLLVDDGVMNLRLLARKLTSGLFKELEWQVETATTGEEALVKIDEARDLGKKENFEGGERMFDLMIIDQNMQPDGILLGTEATSIIRVNGDEEVLIVGCTGNCTDEQRKISKESGQDLLWPKPPPPSETALENLMGALVRRLKKTGRWGECRGVKGGETEKEGAEKEQDVRLPGQLMM